MSPGTEQAASPVEVRAAPVRLVADLPPVPTKVCADGHPNNPDSIRCRICGRPCVVASEVRDRVPTILARLLLEDGTAVDVANDLVIGRSPATDQGMDTLTVSGRQVSRRHLALQARGWEVYISDCDSTNGTFLARQGEKGRRRVPTDAAVLLRIGDAIHFGSRQALVVRPAEH